MRISDWSSYVCSSDLGLRRTAVAVGEVAEHAQLVGEDVGGGAHGLLGIDRAVGLDVDDQLVQVGALLDARGLDLVRHAAHGRERSIQHQLMRITSWRERVCRTLLTSVLAGLR